MSDGSGYGLGWRVHDVVLGVLAGTGAGLVAGVFIVARLLDNRGVVAVASGIGAAAGLWVLHRAGSTGTGATLARAIGWLVLLLTGGFLYLLIEAIRSFE